MKNKYFLSCIILSIFLALGGCKKDETPQEDITFNQNSPIDDPVDEYSDSSDISKNSPEASNETLDHSSQATVDNNQDSSNEASNISDSWGENTFFLSANPDFYEKAACNPIDQKYVIDHEAATLEIWQSALEKCEVWNQQIDFTGSQLEKLLSKADYEQLQYATGLWHEYYQEELYQSRELYGNNGIILGSMYTALAGYLLIEKCRLVSFILLSQEYELSGNVTFAENTAAAGNNSDDSISPQSSCIEYGPDFDETLFPYSLFCIEYSPNFEETLIPYSINEKNSDELEALIHETANTIEETFGHDYAEHTDKYLSFVHALYTIESDISEDRDLCLLLKENRLKLCAVELLNIVYMMGD